MRGLYMAQGSMLSQQVRLELTGNNLANLRTAGFKRDQAVFTTFADHLVYYTGSGRSAAERTRLIGSMPFNLAVSETVTDFGEGPMQETGRALDLALVGPGLFQVQIGGEIYYTREGRFMINPEGFLTTLEGDPVLGENGPVFVGQGDEPLIARDGSILVNGEPVDRLAVVELPPAAEPVKAGENLFTAAPGAAVPAADFAVWSGFLEGSNVDLSQEMVNLVEVRRTYEAAQKVMQTYNSLLSIGANELGMLG